MQYGYVQRTKPVMVIRKGWNPQETLTRGFRSAPVKSGVTIKSGQVIALELVDGEYVWNLADRDNTDHLAQVPHFAQQDSDTTDVRASGQLTGVSSAGQFEIQTGFYVTGTVPLNSGAVLTISSATAGSVETCARGDGPTKPIVGILTKEHVAGPISLVGQDSSATDLNVIRFDTHYDPRNAAS